MKRCHVKIVSKPQCFTEFAKFQITFSDLVLFPPIPDWLQCVPEYKYTYLTLRLKGSLS